jgi:hypothetical protein
MAELKLSREARCAQTKQRNANRRQVAREAHEERMKFRAMLSPAEQLERLNWRFGKDQGAKKERARLNKQLAA